MKLCKSLAYGLIILYELKQVCYDKMQLDDLVSNLSFFSKIKNLVCKIGVKIKMFGVKKLM